MLLDKTIPYLYYKTEKFVTLLEERIASVEIYYEVLLYRTANHLRNFILHQACLSSACYSGTVVKVVSQYKADVICILLVPHHSGFSYLFI